MPVIAACAVLTLGTSTASATPGAPGIGTIWPASIGATTTTLHAEVNPDGSDTTYYFQYGKTSSYGAVAPASAASIGSGVNSVNVSDALSGLAPDTAYHYRVVATNSFGTVASEDQTFNTFGVVSFRASAVNADGSPDVEAGSHPFGVTASVALAQTEFKGSVVPAGAMKDMEVTFPVGLVGSAGAVPQCPLYLLPSDVPLGASKCPPDTQVGLLLAELSSGEKLGLPLYNLVPPAGAPVELGVYAGFFPLTMTGVVRADRDYALSVDLENISQLFPLAGLSMTLWGVPADPTHDPYRGECVRLLGGESTGSCPAGAPLEPFLTLPTACEAPLAFTLGVDAWSQPGESLTAVAASEDGAGGKLEVTGCDRLNFGPSIDVRPDTVAADSPAGVSIDLALPHTDNPRGLAEAALRDMRVTLPRGVSINVAAADGLSACTPAQVGLGTMEEPSCPNSSEIGSAAVDTPLLPVPLAGTIFLGPSGDPFDGEVTAYVVAEGDGVVVKLATHVVADPSTGQLMVTVSKMPQVALTDMRLSFRGGPRAPLATPEGCGTFATTAQLTPYSAPPVSEQPTLTSSFTIGSNCGAGFAPSFVAGSTSTSAGESTGFALELSRADGEQEIRSMSATLPEGVLANLGSVTPCRATQAAAGDCGAASRVGAVTIAAGAGSHPFYLSGAAFLTGPYEGAPFGLSILVPAVAGPFDLGTVTIAARLSLDRHDAQLTIATDPLPTIIKGIPLRIRSIAMTVDRPGFISNPTNCASKQVVGEVVGAQTAARVSSPFALTGCSRLPFSPSVSASTPAGVSRARGAGFDLKIRESRGAHANIGSVAVVFPSQLSARLGAIQQACTRAIFDANPASCPTGSRIGSAEAQTSLLGSRLNGPAYLVSNGTATHPDMAMVLQGEGVTIELRGALRVSHGRALAVTLKNVPDAPISSLEVSLPEGPESVLGANDLSRATGSLCGEKLVLHTSIAGQNGVRVKRSPRVSVSGCRRSRRAR